MWRRILQEPLVHFVVLAALLLLGQRWLAPAEPATIRIDRAAIDTLVRQHAEVRGRPLRDDERQAVIESFIEDQVLLREAYRRGLDQDGVVRKHLIQKMRFMLGEDVPEPTETDLRAHLTSHAERFQSPPSVTLQHVYYADPAAVPDDLLARLQDGLDFRGLGDRLFMLGGTLPRYDRSDLEGLFGDAVAEQIWTAPIGDWQGPLTSEHGVHFVRVVERHPARVPEVAEIEEYLRQDWLLEQQQAAVTAKVAELREHYQIVMEEDAR
jgi:hypothetical protein